MDVAPDAPNVEEHRTAKLNLDAQINELDAKIRVLGADKAEDDRVTKAQATITPTNVRKPAYDGEQRVGEAPSHGGAAPKRGTFIRVNDGRLATVERGASVRSHPVVAERIGSDRDQAIIGQHGSLGQMVRAMTTTSGSAIVPTTWSADVVDRARNMAAVLKAGAEIVPMDSKIVQVGRLTGDPTAAFRAEGSTITASDPTFDNVTLTANTMSCLVVGSLEWFQDADNADEIVTNAIAQAFAQQLDLVALYGSITSGAGTINLASPPNPRGVLGALNAVATSSVLGGAANGTVQTATSYFNELLDTIFTVRDFNETPNAMIGNSKLARQYAKAYDTTGQPLAWPSQADGIPLYISNQVPSYTQGTMTSRATDLFVGDWTQLLIGQRMDFTIQTLTERYAENGQVGIVAHWRGDVQPARPRAFAVYKALQGA
jgi:HK97 family phage major capsid protein